MLTYHLSLFQEFTLVLFLAFLLLFTLELQLLDLLRGQLHLFSHTLLQRNIKLRLRKQRGKGKLGLGFFIRRIGREEWKGVFGGFVKMCGWRRKIMEPAREFLDNIIMQFKSGLLILITVVHIATFSPQILSIQQRINQLQSNNYQFVSKRTRPTPIPTPISNPNPHLPNYTSSQLKFTSKCNQTGPNLHAFLFQTVSNVYFAINSPSQNSLSFYSHRCQHLSTLSNTQIKEILCDRGICQSGTLHFIGKDNHLHSTCQDKNFTISNNLANLQGRQLVGGVIRNRGKDKIQIYIGSQDGVIRVFDESGVGKLRLQLQGFNTKMNSIRDHHPYPIVTMQNSWISMLDTTKYTQISPNCPHLADIRYILSENYYGEAVYVLTKNKIFLVDFELSKKSCMVKREYELGTELGQLKQVSYFSNTIFMDGLVYNLTERKLYKLGVGDNSSMSFIYKKSQSQQIYSIRQWCENQECNVQFFQIKKLNQDRSVLFWLTIAFIAILFLSISFMKKSSINNLDLDDPTRIKEREIQQQIIALTKHAKELSKSNTTADTNPNPNTNVNNAKEKKPNPKQKKQ